MTQPFICLLRGINVSGKNLIKMTDLKQLFVDLSFSHVQTYIQSGNVVFYSSLTDESLLAEMISKAIFSRFGHTVPTLVISAADLSRIFVQNPYPNQMDILHVTFLGDVPLQENIDSIDRLKYLPDVFICVEKALYLICPNGYGNTKLHNQYFEKKLKCKATTRNWKTVTELVNMSKANP